MKILITFMLFSITIFSYTQEEIQNNDRENQEKTLIDFSKYEELNTEEGSPYPADIPENWENDMDLYPITQADMSLDQWIVQFNSSASTIMNVRASRTKKITTQSGEIVLGAHIHFPFNRYLSHAFIRPYYEIMEYNRQGKLSNVGNGVVENVQTVKSLSAVVGGRNYNNRLSIRLIDQNRNVRQFFLGYLNFAGFRKLTWKNTDYMPDVRHRRLFLTPLYPKEPPYYKFESFVVSRPENGYGGDFVVYFKNVTMEYDLYENISQDFEIEDEASWGIKRFHAMRKLSYLRKFHSEKKVLREIEASKMTPSQNVEQQQEQTSE